MRILFVVAYPAASRVRPRELIRGLARRGHVVTVATLWETEADRAGLAQLEAEGVTVLSRHQSRMQALANCLQALPGGEPLQAHYSWNEDLRRTLEGRLNGHGPGSRPAYDVVHVEHLRAARYGLQLQSWVAYAQHRIPVVWDSVDCISHLFEQSSRDGRGFFPQAIARLELPRTRRYEGRLVAQFDRVLATSPVDAAALAQLARAYVENASVGAHQAASLRAGAQENGRIRILPNGVDLTYFAPRAEERKPETLVYLGRMSYHANVAAVRWFCREVLPRVWAERPGVRLQIVGIDPGPSVRALGRDARITVTGTVPDVRPYLATATALVAPMVYGAGIQNKVLEAMAMGTPVVCTPPAAAALAAEPGRDLLVVEGTAGFATAVLGLVADRARQGALGRAGRRYVERHHDWDGIAGRLVEIYREARCAADPALGDGMA